jgi:hypothetical protein
MATTPWLHELYGSAADWFRAFGNFFTRLASRLEIIHAVVHRIRYGSADLPRSMIWAPDLPPDPFRTLIVGANAWAGRQ